MILKYYNLDNKLLEKGNIFLLYGDNEGLKKEVIKKISKDTQILTYDEKQILNDQNEFFESTLTKSLFEPQKIIVIKRATDKLLKVIEEIFRKNLEDITIIINTNSLEKKSKLRTFFEKEKKLFCIAFYPDNEQTISKLAYDFLRKRNISISPSNINSIALKCNGDRENLFNELKKIESYSKSGKKLTSENIFKLTNMVENYSISELVDSCLAKNEKKIQRILNENNFSNEDCVIITRTFLIKAKKILILSKNYEESKNIDVTISSAKPPIFWKDKEITKQQVFKWSPDKIKELIYKISELELLVKKNINNSLNLITDFIIYQSSQKTNN